MTAESLVWSGAVQLGDGPKTDARSGQSWWESVIDGDSSATLLAAFLTGLVAVLVYLFQQAAQRRTQRAAAYAEALRSIEDYLENPYRIRRKDGAPEARRELTQHLSDVKSAINLHKGWLAVHAPPCVFDAYMEFEQAAIDDAGDQMSQAWRTKPTKNDCDVPLGVGYDRTRADAAKAVVVATMRADVGPRFGWRFTRR